MAPIIWLVAHRSGCENQSVEGGPVLAEVKTDNAEIVASEKRNSDLKMEIERLRVLSPGPHNRHCIFWTSSSEVQPLSLGLAHLMPVHTSLQRTSALEMREDSMMRFDQSGCQGTDSRGCVLSL